MASGRGKWCPTSPLFTLRCHPEREIEIAAKLNFIIEDTGIPAHVEVMPDGCFEFVWTVDGEEDAADSAREQAFCALKDAMAIIGLVPHLVPPRVVCFRCGGTGEGYDHTPAFCASMRDLRARWMPRTAPPAPRR